MDTDEIRVKIKLAKAKMRALKNKVKESRVGASDTKVETYIENLLDKILRTKVVKEEDTPYEDMGDPREYLAQWFSNSMSERMVYVLKKAFDKGFPVAKILSSFKRITSADENYDEMKAWLDKKNLEKVEKALEKTIRPTM